MNTFLRLTIFGLVSGATYAVAAGGLVLTYTTSGIFNFAHGAIGMLSAFVYWELHIHYGWPTPLALAVVLLVLAPLTGVLVERFLVRPLRDAPLATTLVVTVGLLAGCLGLAQKVWPPASRVIPQFFGLDGFRVAGVFVSWHQAITLGVALVAAVLLRLLLSATVTGVTMRAVVDDRELTALSGVRPGRPSATSWALGASLAALAGILLAPVITLDAVRLTLLVVNAYAAAVVGRLRSLPLTFLGAMLLGLAQSYATDYLPDFFPGGRLPDWLPGLESSLPVLMLFVALLLLPEARLSGGRSVCAVTARVPSLGASIAGAALLGGAAFVVAGLLSERDVVRVGQGLALGLIGLSLVPLTGYAGQVSLCSLSFAGLGAALMAKYGDGGSSLGLVMAIAVPAAVGVLVALPALRLQGLYLALGTLAFAVLMDNMVFPQRNLFWNGSVTADRPHFFGIGLDRDRDWFVVLAVAYGLLAVIVLALRRGAFGRRLLALRDSPVACATVGLSLVRTKLAVFALSAAMAGLGGALLITFRVSLSAQSFTSTAGLAILLLAVIGGIETASGPLVGGLVVAGMAILSADVSSLSWLASIGPAFVAITLAGSREGLAARLAEVGHNLAGWRSARARISRAGRAGRAANGREGFAALDATLPLGAALRPAEVDALEEVFALERSICSGARS